MNKVLLTPVVLALAAVAISLPSWSAPGIAQVVRYKGHTCEGQSACKNGESSCKGSCNKGHKGCRSEGCSTMTAQECNQAQAGGTYEKSTGE